MIFSFECLLSLVLARVFLRMEFIFGSKRGKKHRIGKSVGVGPVRNQHIFVGSRIEKSNCIFWKQVF